MVKMEKWIAAKGTGIKTEMDFHIYVVIQLVMMILGTGGNLLILTYHCKSDRKYLGIFMTMMSSLDFVLCVASVFILHSDPIGWFTINICCYDQILFSRCIIINFYFFLRIVGNFGRSYHRTAEKMICILHIIILMPSFVICITQVNVYGNIDNMHRSTLYCQENFGIFYGVTCLILTFVSLLTLIGISLQKRHFMKTYTIETTETRRGVYVEENTRGRRMICAFKVNTSGPHYVETGSKRCARNGESHRTILIAIVFMIFFSAVVLHNAIQSDNLYHTELSLGISHNIFLVVTFLIHDCGSPVLYFIFDYPFRMFVKSFVNYT